MFEKSRTRLEALISVMFDKNLKIVYKKKLIVKAEITHVRILKNIRKTVFSDLWI